MVEDYPGDSGLALLLGRGGKVEIVKVVPSKRSNKNDSGRQIMGSKGRKNVKKAKQQKEKKEKGK